MLGAASSRASTYTGTICNPPPPNPTSDPNIQKTIDSWNKYNQFVARQRRHLRRRSPTSRVELPSKVLGSFDPLQVIGKTATITGMLRNNSGQNPYPRLERQRHLLLDIGAVRQGDLHCGTCYKNAFNFWTMDPRRQEDIVVTP